MSKRLEKIKKMSLIRNSGISPSLLWDDVDYLIARVEKLEAFVNNFVGADRVELAIWEKGRLSVMNFDPKSLAEDMTKEDA